MPFVKLDEGILDSTLWVDQVATKVFITALLMSKPQTFDEPLTVYAYDALVPDGPPLPPGTYGFVSAAGLGIVRRAMVRDDAGMQALRDLSSPDAFSRSAGHEGRRLARVDGGYVVLNYMKYRQKDHTVAERVARHRARSTARENASEFGKEWDSVVAFYGGMCAYCGTAPWTDMEHVVPTNRGGLHHISNVVPVCHACYNRRKNKPTAPRARHPLMPRYVTAVTRDVTQAEAEAESQSRGPDSDPSPSPLLTPSPGPPPERSPSAPVTGVTPVTRDKRPARRCPTDWSPTGEDTLKLRSECPSVDLDREMRKFRDCEFRVARSDWNAAWRNWVRRAAETSRPTNGLARARTPFLTTEQIEREMALGWRDEGGSVVPGKHPDHPLKPSQTGEQSR